MRGYEVAWRTYIHGHVVSRHAKQIIVQFMGACCGKSKRADGDAEDIARQTRTCPANEIQLSMMHKIMDDVGEAGNDDVKGSARSKAGANAKERNARGDDSEGEDVKRSELMQNALISTAKL